MPSTDTGAAPWYRRYALAAKPEISLNVANLIVSGDPNVQVLRLNFTLHARASGRSPVLPVRQSSRLHRHGATTLSTASVWFATRTPIVPTAGERLSPGT